MLGILEAKVDVCHCLLKKSHHLDSPSDGSPCTHALLGSDLGSDDGLTLLTNPP